MRKEHRARPQPLLPRSPLAPVGLNSSASPDLELTRPSSTPSIIAILGDLGPGTVINEEALATLFQRSPSSVKRAVDKGELPEPVRFFAQPTWTVRVLVDHLEQRLSKAAQRREEREQSVARENEYEEAILQRHAP